MITFLISALKIIILLGFLILIHEAGHMIVAKWCKVKEETLVKQQKNINRFGLWIAFFSWLPVVGAVGVIALGFYKIRPVWANIVTLIGCAVRFFFWIFLQDIFF